MGLTKESFSGNRKTVVTGSNPAHMSYILRLFVCELYRPLGLDSKIHACYYLATNYVCSAQSDESLRCLLFSLESRRLKWMEFFTSEGDC